MEKLVEASVNQTESISNPIVANEVEQNQVVEVIKPQKPASNILKPVTPDRLKVPKAFKYPERYTSPTDLMMSPISRGLLARSRKTTAPVPLSLPLPLPPSAKSTTSMLST
ncbi:OLC1v1009753C1 [Oldenlandia corymbosa var. corymbosa]|uniref:OLC1v1009753C1 n=1 Tax=Oldenlandia corymbosa var. corymbosa TaxID=529605 RepID=A0AAV1DPQ5_OLDCO|nr:OLC1v1009753C1 [Oldenlandia corymbosa var. corymbosa]